jgi:hypothetical protein
MADQHDDPFGSPLFSDVQNGLSAFNCDGLLAAEHDE